MKVELREHLAKNLATKQMIRARHYRIYVDGRYVGLIGWQDGAKPCLKEEFSPRDSRILMQKIAEFTEQAVGEPAVRPDDDDIPEEEDDAEEDFDD